MDTSNQLAPPGSTAARWALIVCAAFVQIVSGAVYAMGAWQSALRDALGLDTAAISSIGAATFCGALFAMLGGRAFDALGPRTACALGAGMFVTGYTLIGMSVVLSAHLPAALRVGMPALGSAFAGYSSVSLLDNVVCMACSISFPKDRAAIVGYLKAVLASAAGLWALLWVHVFRDGPGLVAYIGFTAAYALGSTLLCLLGLQVLPSGPDRRAFDHTDFRRLALAITFTVPRDERSTYRTHVRPWRPSALRLPLPVPAAPPCLCLCRALRRSLSPSSRSLSPSATPTVSYSRRAFWASPAWGWLSSPSPCCRSPPAPPPPALLLPQALRSASRSFPPKKPTRSLSRPATPAPAAAPVQRA